MGNVSATTRSAAVSSGSSVNGSTLGTVISGRSVWVGMSCHATLPEDQPDGAKARVTALQSAGAVAERLTWLGHSTVLLELSGTRLLTDPVLGSRVMHLRRRAPEPADPGALDAVLISYAQRGLLREFNRRRRCEMRVLPLSQYASTSGARG
jgi:hypothetical protein